MNENRAKALELSKGLPITPSNLSRVAREFGEEDARWAFIQWELRKRGRAKFARADEMLFVREALEQATHESLAAYHASRFPVGAYVGDLTAGIGADLIALARRGPALGYELDAERAECARHNLTVYEAEAEVRVEDCLADGWDFEFAFADPARRVESRRTLTLSEFSPNPELLAERMRRLRLAGMKLSPLLLDSVLSLLGTRVEFLSFGGECREALVWLGQEAVPGRVAVHVESGAQLAPGPDAPQMEEPDAWLFEADPAAIRAHCLGSLCEQFGLRPLGDSNGYLTGPEPVSSPWLRAYRVLETGKGADPRQLKACLGTARAVLKQKGTGLNLEALSKALKGSGDTEKIVGFYPVGKRIRFVCLELQSSCAT